MLLVSQISKEEDATVWARYSSAQFDQGSGRHACNNPYNHILEAELYQKMESTSTWYIERKDFLDLIAPSFSAVEDSEDMATILASTRISLLTENGVHYHVASTEKVKVECIPWPRQDMKDILALEYKPIFKPTKLTLKVTLYQRGTMLIPFGRTNCFANFFEVNPFHKLSLSVIVACLVRSRVRSKELHASFLQLKQR